MKNEKKKKKRGLEEKKLLGWGWERGERARESK